VGWCVSVGGSAVALIFFRVQLELGDELLQRASAFGFFAIASCGFVPMWRQIQGEYFPGASGRGAARALLACAENCLLFLCVYSRPSLDELIGKMNVLLISIGTTIIGAVWGYVALQGQQERAPLASSRGLEENATEERESESNL
jgi:hypothetical protein